MFRNKHVIAALIITPILSVLGYFAVDHLVAEKPHAARSGESYELAPRSSCRYTSGHCALVNGEFKLDIEGRYADNGTLALTLRSTHPLQGGRVAVVDQPDAVAEPVALVATDDSQQAWRAVVPAPDSADALMRVAVSADDSLYFGESGLAFTHYETSFGRDFRGDEQ